MTAAVATSIPRRTGPVHRAIRDILPIGAAVVPFGAVVGVTLDQVGLTGFPALLATGLLYAGSAQLATLSVLLGGGGLLAAVVAGAVVNSRMLLYSASLSPNFRGHPSWFRWFGPLTTVDQTYALVGTVDDLPPAGFRRYWLALGATLMVFWVGATGLGVSLGSVVPTNSPMEVAAPATLVALLVPHLRDGRLRRAAATAAVVSALGVLLPSGVGIVLAITVALVVAGPTTAEVAR